MKRTNKYILTIAILVSLATITFIGFQQYLMNEVSAQTEMNEGVPIFIPNENWFCSVRISDEEKIERQRRFRADLAARGPNPQIITGGVVRIHWFVRTYGSAPEQGNLTDQHIADQMTSLNQNFAKTGWQFVLSRVDRRGMVNSTDIYPAYYSQPLGRDIKIFTENWRFNGSYFHSNHEIHIDYRLIFPNQYQNQYGQTHVTTHEVGHWFQLDHTFAEGSCNKPGDFVRDTPAALETGGGCPVRLDTCRPTAEMNPSTDEYGDFDYGGLDPIHNFMGRNDESCKYEFTRGQDQRMDEMFTLYHAGR